MNVPKTVKLVAGVSFLAAAATPAVRKLVSKKTQNES